MEENDININNFPDGAVVRQMPTASNVAAQELELVVNKEPVAQLQEEARIAEADRLKAEADRKEEELRRQEEARIAEADRLKAEADRKEEELRRQEEELRRQEEEFRRIEEDRFQAKLDRFNRIPQVAAPVVLAAEKPRFMDYIGVEVPANSQAPTAEQVAQWNALRQAELRFEEEARQRVADILARQQQAWGNFIHEELPSDSDDSDFDDSDVEVDAKQELRRSPRIAELREQLNGLKIPTNGQNGFGECGEQFLFRAGSQCVLYPF